MVDAYKSDELASGDKDAKRIEKAEKVVEQRAEKKRKRMALKASRSCPVRQSIQPSRDTGSYQGPSRNAVAAPIGQSPQLPRRLLGLFPLPGDGSPKGQVPEVGQVISFESVST